MVHDRQGGFGGGFRGGRGVFTSGPAMRFGPRLSPVIKVFLIACGAAFLLQNVFPDLNRWLTLNPSMFFRGALWQAVTFNFLHANATHLLMNLFMVWMFGSELESHMGRRRFILLMAVSGIGAGLCQALAMYGTDSVILGASGIVFGLLLVYGMTWPDRIVLVMLILPMRVKWMVVLFGAIEFLGAVGTQTDRGGIAHLAHLGGMIFAYIFMRYDKIYMSLRRGYYERKLEKYRKKFRVHEGGRGDDPPSFH